VAGALLLAGAGVGAWLLPRYVDPALPQAEIVAATERTDELVATDPRCPDDVVQEQGGTFTCTATVVGRQITCTVTRTDDTGTAVHRRPGAAHARPGRRGRADHRRTRTELGVEPTDVQCPIPMSTSTATALSPARRSCRTSRSPTRSPRSTASGRCRSRTPACSGPPTSPASSGQRSPRPWGRTIVAECGQAGQTVIVNEPGDTIDCRAFPAAEPSRVVPIPIKVDRSGQPYPA